MNKPTIQLPDGYNGAVSEFFSEPIEIDGNLVKLKCAEDGKEWLIRWARISDVIANEIAGLTGCPKCGTNGKHYCPADVATE